MTHVSLFTGIGGLDIAAEWAGIETVLQVERDPYCLKVLDKHWPGVPRITDIREVTSESVDGPVDIVSGGFPCQPFSQAGKRGGTEDDRYLWPEMLRVIQELSPRWVVAENVSGLLSLDGGLVFERVLSDLELAGYSVLPLHYPAAGVGALHRRDRVFIVAYSNDARRRWREKRRPRWDRRLALHSAAGNVADTAGIGWRERNKDTGRRAAGAGTEKKRPRLTDRSWWELEPDVGGAFARLPSWMDGGRLDANAKEAGTRKILRVLRSENAPQYLRYWPVGGLGGVQKAEVLQPPLCQPEAAPEALGNLSLQGKETPRAIVRGVWFRDRFACAPCRRKARKQLTGEHPDSLCLLSQLLACDCGATWLGATGAFAADPWSGSWEMNISRTATGVKGRAARLRVLGNAVVPQQAYPIFKAIAELEG